MTNRRGIIAALAGILPLLSLNGQDTFVIDPKKLEPSLADPFVSFSNSTKQVRIGWALQTMELIVEADGRKARISAKEIMDALEKP